eukprot:scaffold100410_cov67-Phaeocystis_antarctica.AAC.2
MGQIIFYSNSGAEIDMSGVVATNPGGSNPVNEGTEKTLIAASLTSNEKWLDFNYGDLVLAFPNTVQVAAYSFTNVHANRDRTPVRWTLDASNDGINWQPLDRTYENISYVLPGMDPSKNCEAVVCAVGPFTIPEEPGGAVTAECTSAWTTFGGMGTQCGYSAESCASKQTACTLYAASITEAKMQEMATGFASCTGDLVSLTMYNAEALKTSMLDTFNRCGVTTPLTPLALNTCHGAFSKYTGMSSECGYEGTYTCSASACIANAASASDSMVASMVTGLATCTGDYASYGSYTAESLTQSFLSTINACGLISALTPLSLSTCIGAMTKVGEMSSCGDDGADADNP